MKISTVQKTAKKGNLNSVTKLKEHKSESGGRTKWNENKRIEQEWNCDDSRWCARPSWSHAVAYFRCHVLKKEHSINWIPKYASKNLEEDEKRL